MRIGRIFRHRLRSVFLRSRADEDLQHELDLHIEQLTREHIAAGISESEARLQARRAFGSFEITREHCRDTRRVNLVEEFVKDLGLALRQFKKSPGFALTAVLSLTLGIGANTAVFSLLDQVLLQLLPVKHPEQLVLVAERGVRFGSSWGDNDISYPMYRDFRDHNQVFSGMFCRFPTDISLGYGDRTERVSAELVSGSYFPVLGVAAQLGRILTPDDDRVPGGHPVAMLSYNFWQAGFSSDRSIIGKQILVNGHAMTVIGVAQAGFDGVELGYKSKVFVPMMMEPALTNRWSRLEQRQLSWVMAFGRLKPSIGRAQAAASLQPLIRGSLEAEAAEPEFRHYSDYDRAQFLKNSVELLSGSQGWSDLRKRMRTPLWALMALTGAVLLLACANLANLLLTRATTREREMAVRLAIGSGRARIIRLLLTESLLLSALGAATGLGLTSIGERFLVSIYLSADNTGELPLSSSPHDGVLAFAFLAMLGTALAFGLAPALRSSRVELISALKDRAGSAAGGREMWLRRVLVVGQIVLSVLLLVGASLFARTLANLESAGPGFSTERLMAFSVDPSLNGYSDARAKDFFRRLTIALQAMPGVASVGLSTMPVLQGHGWNNPIVAEGRVADPGQGQQPTLDEISPNLFATLALPIIEGRDFTTLDTRPVVLVNEAFAKEYFAGRNPIGLHIGLVDDRTAAPDVPNREVIGVVRNMKFRNLRDPAPSQVYLPYLQSDSFRFMTFYLRTRLDPRQSMNAVQQQVRRLDPNIPVDDMRTVDDQIGISLSTERMVASLSAVFGSLATLLAVVGLYGMMAFTMTRRTREIGIRMALGARQSDVISMVMREVLILIGAGLVLGVPLAVILSRLVRNQLYGLQPNDPVTIAGSALLLIVAAGVAGLIPALRASRIHPTDALRCE